MNLTYFIVFFITLIIGVPVYFCLGLTILYYFLINGIDPWMILQRVFIGLNSFTVLAVPMFLLAGSIMDTGGTLKRIIKFSRSLVGHLRGGMAHVNIVTSMFFAGITGNATADVAALGPLEVAMMTDQGYEKDYSAAVTVASSCVGPIIPPSMPMVMYAITANVSIGTLFMAGLLPGVIMGLALMILVAIMAKIQNIPSDIRTPFKELFFIFLKSASSLMLPVIILGGIYSGLFTPTESAAVACLYAFILGVFVFKELKWKNIKKMLIDTGTSLSSACVIFAIASCFSYVIASENIPSKIAELLLSISSNKYVLLLLINVALLIIGCFMEGLSAMLIMTPILVPTIIQVGISPVQFGVIAAINLTLGLLTPPLGISLFIASSFTGVPVLRIAKKATPFFLTLLFILLLVTFIPSISLFIPNLFGYTV